MAEPAVISGGTATSALVSEAPATAIRPLILQAVGIWLATRIGFLVFTYFDVTFFQPGAHSAGSILGSWQRWDADWYINIARHGYFNAQSAAFFPLFPGLTRIVSIPFFGHTVLAAIVVANLGTLAALIGIALIAAHERANRATPHPDPPPQGGRENSATAAMAIAVSYPFAFFMIVPYAEGLLFGLIALSLYFSRRAWWWPAAAAGFLAALSRPTGMIVFLPIVWEVGRQHGWWASLRHRRWLVRMSPKTGVAAAAAVLSAPAGLIAFMLFLGARFGDPLLFIHAQERYWGRQTMSLIDVISLLVKNLAHTPAWTAAQALELSALLPVIGFTIVTIAYIRRLPFAFTLLMAALLFLTLDAPILAATEKIESAGRELAVAVPVFVALGGLTAKRPGLQMLLVGTGFLLQAVFAQIFLARGWIA